MSDSERTSIDLLASTLSDATLEELRQGPNFLDADRSGPMLDSDFPPLPVEAATVDKSQCYVLGWLREEVATRMMKVANLAVKPRGDPAYYQTTVYALRYMWRRSEYFHAWTSYGFMDSGEGAGTAGLVDESRRQREDFAGWPLIAISCTVEEARQRRPSKAQFEWFKHVMGKEPRWFLIDSSYYSLARDGLWDAAPCCLKGAGLSHLVDLETGEWKCGQECHACRGTGKEVVQMRD